MEPYSARFSALSRPVPLKHTHNDAELNRKRRHNALRFKNTFESIIDRYSEDFSEVGDVIDLRSEKLVIDNGHLKNLKGELDPAYEEIWVDASDSEDGQGDGIENNEDMDELCGDMVASREKTVGKSVMLHTTNEPPRDIQSEQPKDNSELGIYRSQNNDQASLLPQLETAIQTMTSIFQQQMMDVLGSILPTKTPHSHLKRRFETLSPTPPITSRERNHMYLDDTRIHSLSKAKSTKRRRILDPDQRMEMGSHGNPLRQKFRSISVEKNVRKGLQWDNTTPLLREKKVYSPKYGSHNGLEPWLEDPLEILSSDSRSAISSNFLNNIPSEGELRSAMTPGRTSKLARKVTSPRVVVGSQRLIFEQEGDDENEWILDDEDIITIHETPSRATEGPDTHATSSKPRLMPSLSPIKYENGTEQDTAWFLPTTIEDGYDLPIPVPVDDVEKDPDFRPSQPVQAMNLGKRSRPHRSDPGMPSSPLSPSVPLLSLAFQTSSREFNPNLRSQSQGPLEPSPQIERKRGRPRTRPLVEHPIKQKQPRGRPRTSLHVDLNKDNRPTRRPAGRPRKHFPIPGQSSPPSKELIPYATPDMLRRKKELALEGSTVCHNCGRTESYKWRLGVVSKEMACNTCYTHEAKWGRIRDPLKPMGMRDADWERRKHLEGVEHHLAMDKEEEEVDLI